MNVEYFLTLSLLLSGLVLGARRSRLFEDRRVSRALRSTRAQPIAQVRDGRVVKIAGAVELAERRVVAPLSKRPGAYYLLVIEEQRITAAGPLWVEVLREERRGELLVRDATGRANVVLDGANILIQRDFEGIADTHAILPPALDALLAAHRLVLKRKTVRYSEGILEAGDPIAVAGLARWEPDPSPATGGAYRDVPMRLKLRVSGKLPLLVSDDPETLV